ncbi:MAG: DUF1707 domain-containing protein [Gemmatimonadota bacterium]
MNGDLPAEPLSASARERVAEELCAHFARDHLDLDELERRLDRVYTARLPAELDALTAGLPVLAEDTERRPGVRAAPRSATPAKRHDLVISVMGGAERSGSWVPPERLTVLTLMGGATLDFREAEFASDEVEVTVVSLMGGAEILLPPWVRAEVNGIAIMGGFERNTPGLSTDPGAPLVRVRGFVLMGGVEVKVRLPGESSRQARRRLKEARRIERKRR